MLFLFSDKLIFNVVTGIMDLTFIINSVKLSLIFAYYIILVIRLLLRYCLYTRYLYFFQIKTKPTRALI